MIAVITAGHLLTDVGHSLREAGDMAWATLWALVLGFALSGAVQAFVTRNEMRSRLGDHRPRAALRATTWGTASSSCSYAASAMARSLVARGADFTSAVVFMVASTNLVLELGIVLVVLLGWAFLGAEVVGGIVLIAVVLLLGGWWWGRRRPQLAAAEEAPAQDALDRGPLRERLRSPAGWADAAGYAISDLRMVRKEILVGFVVAGFLTELVPGHVWSDVFLRGHGFATTLENVVVGPLLAVVSFVCSVGNVPFAAALWHGGASFGGVVSFVFADLITLPLLAIYRRQYGTATALRMFVVLGIGMAAAGLVTEEVFRGLGILPHHRPHVVAGHAFGLNVTTGLDVLALVVFAGLWWLHRNRERFGGGQGYATDPVCGMQVEIAHAPAHLAKDGQDWWFCSEHCRDRFATDGAPSPAHTSSGEGHAPSGKGPVTDPVCGMEVDPAHAPHLRRDGKDWWFCCEGCRGHFASTGPPADQRTGG